MKFILIPFVAMVACLVIKFILFFARGGTLSKRAVIWEGFWVAKFPSTHGAMIASALYVLGRADGFSAMFGFALIVSIFLVYGLLEDKKRQELLESYFIKSKDDELKKLVTDRKLYDFNGHTPLEMLVGIVIGLLVGVVFS